jgi:chitinase
MSDNITACVAVSEKKETELSLSMTIKAAVQDNRILFGFSSYRRRYKTTDSSCTAVSCTCIGSAIKIATESGQCAGTLGYISNARLHSLMESYN